MLLLFLFVVPAWACLGGLGGEQCCPSPQPNCFNPCSSPSVMGGYAAAPVVGANYPPVPAPQPAVPQGYLPGPPPSVNPQLPYVAPGENAAASYGGVSLSANQFPQQHGYTGQKADGGVFGGQQSQTNSGDYEGSTSNNQVPQVRIAPQVPSSSGSIYESNVHKYELPRSRIVAEANYEGGDYSNSKSMMRTTRTPYINNVPSNYNQDGQERPSFKSGHNPSQVVPTIDNGRSVIAPDQPLPEDSERHIATSTTNIEHTHSTFEEDLGDQIENEAQGPELEADYEEQELPAANGNSGNLVEPKKDGYESETETGQSVGHVDAETTDPKTYANIEQERQGGNNVVTHTSSNSNTVQTSVATNNHESDGQGSINRDQYENSNNNNNDETEDNEGSDVYDEKDENEADTETSESIQPTSEGSSSNVQPPKQPPTNEEYQETRNEKGERVDVVPLAENGNEPAEETSSEVISPQAPQVIVENTRTDNRAEYEVAVTPEPSLPNQLNYRPIPTVAPAQIPIAGEEIINQENVVPSNPDGGYPEDVVDNPVQPEQPHLMENVTPTEEEPTIETSEDTKNDELQQEVTTSSEHQQEVILNTKPIEAYPEDGDGEGGLRQSFKSSTNSNTMKASGTITSAEIVPSQEPQITEDNTRTNTRADTGADYEDTTEATFVGPQRFTNKLEIPTDDGRPNLVSQETATESPVRSEQHQTPVDPAPLENNNNDNQIANNNNDKATEVVTSIAPIEPYKNAENPEEIITAHEQQFVETDGSQGSDLGDRKIIDTSKEEVYDQQQSGSDYDSLAAARGATIFRPQNNGKLSEAKAIDEVFFKLRLR